MQINYCNFKEIGPSPLYWGSPSVDNSLRAMDGPAVYAPYGTPGYWKVHSTPPAVSYLQPNPAMANSPMASAIRAGLLGDVPPASSPDTAAAAALPLGPISLVSPMPSITQPSQDQVSTTSVPPAQTPPTCSISTWVSNNPALAALAAVGVYLFMSQGGRR